MDKGRKPEIVCIGAQKAGTSWLHVTLATRSDIWVPPFKEMHFFDNKFLEECRRWAPWHVKRGVKLARERYLARTAQPDEAYLAYLRRLEQAPMLNGTWYKFVFSQAREDQKCLDVTPEYSCIPETGVEFFKRFLPHSKLIYIIRHPLDRLKSQLRMNAHRKKELPSSRGDWLELLEMPALQTRGDYISNVPRWDAYYLNDQLLYLPFGQIKKDPVGFLRKVEIHCDLPARKYARAESKVHQTKSLQLPNFVLERLDELAKPQSDFILRRFGKEFFDDT